MLYKRGGLKNMELYIKMKDDFVETLKDEAKKRHLSLEEYVLSILRCYELCNTMMRNLAHTNKEKYM